MELNQDQITKLQNLGLKINQKDNVSLLSKGEAAQPRGISKFTIFPLLSISGLTILSFSGLILLKSKNSQNVSPINIPNSSSDISPTPTQVPKSIQHYLLTSQQYFSKALQLQSSQDSATAGSDQQLAELLNQSILAATQAIKEFPSDYRGYYQRARIYQSILKSNPKLISQVISDLSAAQKLEPNNAEITRSLASVYAQKGDAQNTLTYLNQTIILEPTKAQNFYDLAKIQQQVGLLPQALDTYDRLITLISDPTQVTQIKSEKSAIEKLISQNPASKDTSSENISLPTISPIPLNLDSPTIQALADSGLIIAAPESLDKIEVSTLTDSNAYSGTATLPANQKEINITNDNLLSTSQVYITATKGGKNQNLQVLSKSDKSFTVGLSSAINEEVEFKWWIIN